MSTKQSEHYVIFGSQCDGVPLASWVSELCLSGEVKPIGGAVAKASLNRAIQSLGTDPKSSDLSMARMKLR